MGPKQRTPAPAAASGRKRTGIPHAMVLTEGRVAGTVVKPEERAEIDRYLARGSGYCAIVTSHLGYAYALQKYRGRSGKEPIEIDFRPHIAGETRRLDRLANRLLRRMGDEPDGPIIFCKGLDALDLVDTGILWSLLAQEKQSLLISDSVRKGDIISEIGMGNPLASALHWIGDQTHGITSLPPLSPGRKLRLKRSAVEVATRAIKGCIDFTRVCINIYGPSGSGKTTMAGMLPMYIGPTQYGVTLWQPLRGTVDEIECQNFDNGTNDKRIVIVDEADRLNEQAYQKLINDCHFLVVCTHQPIKNFGGRSHDRVDLGDPKRPPRVSWKEPK